MLKHNSDKEQMLKNELKRQYPAIGLASTLVELCAAKGIAHVVISPGSRNAPLSIGFDRHPDVECHVVVDERSAAFYAMGLAKEKNEMVALVCTSGSAVLNYYPAVAEAFYSHIPLVVLSADRPQVWIDQADGQTIRQDGVLAQHCGYSAQLKEGQLDAIRVYNEREINRAINTALTEKTPVHLNVPFSEPLYELVDEAPKTPRIIHPVDRPYELDELDLQRFLKQWEQADKKMVLVGVHKPDREFNKLILELAKDPSVAILTETTSNLYGEELISEIDKVINTTEEASLEELRPDMLITMGGMIVSKKIKALLRSYELKTHWCVSEYDAPDTYQALSDHIRMEAKNFIPHLLQIRRNSEYAANWQMLLAERRCRQAKWSSEVEYSDFLVNERIYQALPEGMHLELSNSATVRYSQLFELPSSITVSCNRGTSGIDGSTSTAVGASVALQRPVTLLTGDISFFYDSNAFWNERLRSDFRVIVVNNSGGGIFRIIPGPGKSGALEKYFETRHDLNARHLAAMYGLSYRSASNEAELCEHLETFWDASEQAGILEVFTPPELNDKVLKSYWEALKNKLNDIEERL